MLIRLLDFALLSFLAWMIWTQVFRQWRAGIEERRRAAGGPPPGAAPHTQRTRWTRRTTGATQQPAALTLARCSACGVHVPSDRMLPGRAGEAFCSPACQARGAAGPATRP